MAKYTVATLIEALKEMPPSLEVSLHDIDTNYCTFDIELLADPEADALYIKESY